MRRLKRLAGDEEAAELVEFAISAWILFMLCAARIGQSPARRRLPLDARLRRLTCKPTY
jgi:hypothetical protein